MVTTRVATAADASTLAALHLETLPGDVSDFTPLGGRIVRRFYANAITRGVATACLAGDGAGPPLGFVLVTPDISTLFPRALLSGSGDVLRFVLGANPFGLARALITKLTSGTAQVPAAPELVYLGVTVRARGRGVGGLLVDAADVEFRRQGITRYELNVHEGNVAAVKLYFTKGFEVARRYEKGGHTMYNMTRVLAPAAK